MELSSLDIGKSDVFGLDSLQSFCMNFLTFQYNVASKCTTGPCMSDEPSIRCKSRPLCGDYDATMQSISWRSIFENRLGSCEPKRNFGDRYDKLHIEGVVLPRKLFIRRGS